MSRPTALLLHELASKNPDTVAWRVFESENPSLELSWTELEKAIFNRAQSLWELGVRPGKKILLWADPGTFSLTLDFALQSIGASILWVPGFLKASEIESHFWNFSPEFLFCQVNVADWEGLSKIPDLKIVFFPNTLNSSLEILNKADFGTGEIATEDLTYEMWVNFKIPKAQDEIFWSLTQGLKESPKLFSHSQKNFDFTLSTFNEILKNPSSFEFLGCSLQAPTLWVRLISRLALEKGNSLVLGQTDSAQNVAKLNKHKIFLFLTGPQVDRLFFSLLGSFLGKYSAVKTLFTKKEHLFKNARSSWVDFKRRMIKGLPSQSGRFWLEDRLKPLEVSILKQCVDRKLASQIAGICVYNGSLDPVLRQSLESLEVWVNEIYSLTEACGPVGMCDWRVSPDPKRYEPSQMRPLPEVNVTLSKAGEIQIQSPGLSELAAPNDQGFYETGDHGTLFSGGGFRVIGRKGELLTLESGQKVDPRLVKRVFSEEPLLSRIFIFGEARPFVAALLTLKPHEARKVADFLKIPFFSVPDLIDHPSFLEFLKKRIQELNSRLKEHEKVKRYAVLKQDFSNLGGELSTDGQLRIQFCMQKYRQHIDQIYKGKVI